MEKYKSKEFITRVFELSKARSEIEARYLNIKGIEIENYQKMLSLLMCENSAKKEIIKNLPKRNYSQEELWKYGISGDYPIMLVNIKDINDIDIIDEILKAHEFFRAKNIKVDIVILNKDKNIYEQYIKEGIENCIQNRQVSFLLNNSGGIYILNYRELNKEDIEMLHFRANIIIDAHLGSIANQLEI